MAAAIFTLALAGGGFGEVELGVAAAAVWLLIAGLGLGGRLSFGGMRAELGLALGLLALLAVWTAFSFGWASDDGAAFVDLARALLYLGAVALAGLSARPAAAPSWLAGLALGGVAIALLAVASRTLGFGGDDALAAELPRAAERLSYPLGYWNALGYLMAMTLPALAWLAAGDRDGVARLAVAGSIPVVLALFLTSSRGALLAAALGLALVAVFTSARPRLLLAAAVALPAWLLVVVVAAVRRAELDAASGISASGLAVAIVTVVAIAAAYYVLGRIQERDAAVPISLPRLGPAPIAALVVLVLALVAVVGPSSFLGEFRTQGTADPQQATSALVSGSGRSSFWRVAVEAFGSDPLRGVGAGGYPYYWNVEGDLPVPVANAHSAPLETFAELGLVGGLALLALLALGLLAAWRPLFGADRDSPVAARRRAAAGAAAGVYVAGLVAIAIDWTWQIPAAVAPLLIALALLCGQALRPPAACGSQLVDPRIAGYERHDSPVSVPGWLIGGGLAVAALASVWVGVVLAVASVQLERSEDRLAEGDLVGAASAARAAAAIEPWSPEPSLRLAEIEQAGANLQAARRRAEEAVRLSPQDFRPWLLLSEVQGSLGNAGAGLRYLQRATLLGPRILSARDIREGFN